MSAKLFSALCRSEGLPEPETEHRFHPTRKWRFDYAWQGHKIAMEVEGGLFARGGGRHNRGAGMLKDMEKYNAAQCMGWIVLRCVPEKLNTLATVEWVKDAMYQRESMEARK